MSTEPALKTKIGEAERFSIQAAALGASLEIRLYLPHSQAQGWRHTARQVYPRRKKKALSPPTPSHPSKVPLLPGDCRLTLSSASLFLCRSFSAEAQIPPNRTDNPRRAPSQSFHSGGHASWRPSRSARGPRRGRPQAARNVEKMPVLGTEDWDFVGQLN